MCVYLVGHPRLKVITLARESEVDYGILQIPTPILLNQVTI